MSPSLSVLIDTHVLLWVLARSKRLKEVSWINEFRCLTVSPVSLLEMKFLQEVGKLDADLPQIVADLRKDTRFQIDDVALENLCLAAFDITWTRDPFDRLLVAHSRVRSLPLGTRDGNILKNYSSVL